MSKRENQTERGATFWRTPSPLNREGDFNYKHSAKVTNVREVVFHLYTIKKLDFPRQLNQIRDVISALEML